VNLSSKGVKSLKFYTQTKSKSSIILIKI